MAPFFRHLLEKPLEMKFWSKNSFCHRDLLKESSQKSLHLVFCCRWINFHVNKLPLHPQKFAQNGFPSRQEQKNQRKTSVSVTFFMDSATFDFQLLLSGTFWCVLCIFRGSRELSAALGQILEHFSLSSWLWGSNLKCFLPVAWLSASFRSVFYLFRAVRPDSRHFLFFSLLSVSNS